MENCKWATKGIKKARPKAGFCCALYDNYSSTTKFFTSQVADALLVLVYLKAIVTI